MGKIDYDFELVNPTKFKLKFTLDFSNRLLIMAFNKSKVALRSKHNLVVDEDISKIKEFDADPRFYKLVKVGIAKQINKVCKEVKGDGIIVLNNDIKKITYKKLSAHKWITMIFLEGDCYDKR